MLPTLAGPATLPLSDLRAGANSEHWCGNSVENVPHMLRCLNTWSSVDGTLWVVLEGVWRKSVTGVRLCYFKTSCCSQHTPSAGCLALQMCELSVSVPVTIPYTCSHASLE